MTTNDALTHLQQVLQANDYPTSYLSELKVFLALTQQLNDELSSAQKSRLQHILFLLKDDYPVEYIVQRALFYERYFFVNRDVLIPRFDSEALVKWVIELPIYDKPATIIDIGTGSGALMISCAKELLLKQITTASYVATDISDLALQVARKNTALHEVNKIVTFYNTTFPTDSNGNVLIPETDDIVIITNPPYISDRHMKMLPKSITYEPALALQEQPGLLPTLQTYINVLQDAGKKVHVAIEYNDSTGYMVQRFSTGQQVDLQALLSA
jgi:HemK-like putative methylase